METVVYIGGKEIIISATLRALMEYKRNFGEEYLDRFLEIAKVKDTEKLASDITITAFRLIWAMAKAADRKTPPPDKWLSEFESTDGFLAAVGKAEGLFMASAGVRPKESHKKEKKNEKETKMITTEEYLALALRAGIDYSSALDMTIGELNGVLGALIKDSPKKESVREATQADFDRFKR